MGTDIHAVFQMNKDGDWKDVVSYYDENRDYRLFTRLANVRNAGHEIPAFMPRGVPADFVLNDSYSWILFDTDSHNHSWLSADEILSCEPIIDKFDFDYFTNEIKRLKDLHRDVRMVFWFDS